MSALRDAYDLIKDEERWTQGTFARTKAGSPTSPFAPSAARFCAHGALERFRASSDLPNRMAMSLFPSVSAVMEVGCGCVSALAYVNDRLGHEAVLQVFEKAICETEGSL